MLARREFTVKATPAPAALVRLSPLLCVLQMLHYLENHKETASVPASDGQVKLHELFAVLHLAITTSSCCISLLFVDMRGIIPC